MYKIDYKLCYLLLCLSGFLWGCNEDFMEKRPLDGYSELDVFDDEVLAQNFINGSYRGIRFSFDDENSFTDGLTDNGFNQHGSAEGSIRIYTRAEVSQDDGEAITRDLWQHSFNYITRTNQFFDKTQSTAIPPHILSGMEGEMHFLRAYFYFELMKWYGEVPIIDYPFVLGQDNYDVSRAGIDEVVNFIVSDCDEAIEKLAGKNELPSGKASREAAMALKAKTLLYAASPLYNENNDQSKWVAARDANRAVMDIGVASLISTPEQYGDMFSGHNQSEVIFSRYFTQTNNQGWGVNLWLFPNSYGGWATITPTQDLVDDYELVSGTAIDDPNSGYDPQNPYQGRDPRFYQSIIHNQAVFQGSTYDPYLDAEDPSDPARAGKDSRLSSNAPHNATRTGYNFRKYTDEERGDQSGNVHPFIVFRLAEFYLNFAECELALGNEPEARMAINAVRNRIGMPDVTSSGERLLEDYRRERRIELVLEDHRFFDMRRWMMGSEMLDKPATGVDVLRNPDGSFAYNYSLVADQNRRWQNRMYFLPIPFNEIQRSNNRMTQNPGY